MVANPYALLDFDAFRDGLSHQSEASGDGGGKLGLSTDSGIVYYLGTLTWGLGWLPALAALGGAIGLAVRDRRLALVLVPAPVVVPGLHGHPGPLLRALAAARLPAAVPAGGVGGGRGGGWLAPAAAAAAGLVAGVLGALLCVQGLVFSVHNDACSPAPTPASSPATGWSRNVPIRSKVVVEPFVPDRVGGRRAERPRGHRQRLPLEQVADLARARRRSAAA